MGIKPATLAQPDQADPMLNQLSYEVKLVRMCDISELASSFDICLLVIYCKLVNQRSKGLIPVEALQANFSACPVWIDTQSNITITFCTRVHHNIIHEHSYYITNL